MPNKLPEIMDYDYEAFALNLKQKKGIDITAYKDGQMKRRLNHLRESMGFASFLDLYHAMASNPSLYIEFIRRITIHVTEFFRNPVRWEVLERKIIPELLEKSRTLKCWSAACSTGEEPYSLAMLLHAFLDYNEIDILATDLDSMALKTAAEGVYSAKAVKTVPQDKLEKYFVPFQSKFKVIDSLRNRVTFRQHNLLSDPYERDFDLIICRNVLIYFTDETKEMLFQKLSDSLRPGGYLFIGGTEQIFHPKRYRLEPIETFFYRRM